MADVKVLIEGYTDLRRGVACPTISLVTDGSLTMIVDPGTVDDPQSIVDALQIEGLSPDTITVVCITHSHFDHYKYAGMFAHALTLEYWGLWTGNRLESNTQNRSFSKNIEILMTPGHSYDSLTLLVSTSRGVVAVCGDVFWDEHGPQIDELAQDHNILAQSRSALFTKAQWIVPGHGAPFRIPNKPYQT